MKTTISFELPAELKKAFDAKLREVSKATMVRRSITAQLVMLIKDFVKDQPSNLFKSPK